MLALSASNAFPWLEGRFNGRSFGLVLNLLGLLAWIALTLGLLSRVAKLVGERGRRKRAWLALLVAVAFLPWSIGAVQEGAMTVFTEGFRGWATAHVDAHAIQDWRANLTITVPATAPAPYWWPTTEYQVPIGVPVPRGSFSSAIAALHADEVRVLPELEGVLFAWKGGRVGWVRFVLVGSAACAPPEELKRHDVNWQLLRPGVYTGVVAHH